MRWYKHRTDASDGEFLSEIIEIFGLEGYARWFILLEKIGAKMDETNRCSATYPWVKWQLFLRGKRNKLETFLVHCQNKLKLNLKQTGNILEIECPKLLEMRDNYTKNLQAADNKIASIEVDIDIDKDKYKDKDLKTCPEQDSGQEFLVPTRDGGIHVVTGPMIEKYERLYPDVDVRLEIQRSIQWCENNPKRRKVNVDQFLTGWIGKSQKDAEARLTPKQRRQREIEREFILSCEDSQ